jgi:hypothetical protein
MSNFTESNFTESKFTDALLYMASTLTELEKKFATVNSENAKLSSRIAELERSIDVVDTEYVQVSSNRWLSVKDTKDLDLYESACIRPNMLCKLINLEALNIYSLKCHEELETYANKNVKRILIGYPGLPNFENFPSCRILFIDHMELEVSTIISTLSEQKHNIRSISFGANGYWGMRMDKDKLRLENYCKTSGIEMTHHY